MPPIAMVARRRLDAARLVGAAAVAALGQFAVDAPQGYFGPIDRITPLGLEFLLLVGALAVIGASTRLAGLRVAYAAAVLQLVVVIVAFVPPLASDPILAGAEILWHLLLFGALVLPGGALGRWGRVLTADERTAEDHWYARNGPAARHLLGVSVAVAVAVLGYRLGDRMPAQLITLALGALAVGLSAPFLFLCIRRRPVAPALALMLFVAAAATFRKPEIALSLLTAGQAGVLVELWLRSRVIGDLLELFLRRPAYLVLASFLVIIGLGTLFLSFPIASQGPHAVSPIDAWFTATSAACVTGLIVLDTPHDFSTFGLITILVLIQAGGLNIMVLSAFAAILLGRDLGLRGEGALGQVLDVQSGRSARRLVVFIVVSTFAVEVGGALLLSLGYFRHGYSAASAAWYGLFHAVSAFCNAGFSLHSDSLMRFRGDPLFLLVVAFLITLGGLGFSVLAHFWRRVTGRSPRASGVQARIVMYASAALVVIGTALYCLAEWNHTLRGLGPVDRVTNALFQSVTLRTAGFTSLSLDGLRPVTSLIMMVFMFIGASPGGTGGGLKTTTTVVLLGSIVAIIVRRSRVVLLRHRIPLETVYRSAAIAVIGALVVVGGCAVLLASQRGPFEVLAFETFSAFGTVGLSLGATADLDAVGKVTVILLMLVGRVGPLTLALLLARKSTARITYPEARIMVG